MAAEDFFEWFVLVVELLKRQDSIHSGWNCTDQLMNSCPFLKLTSSHQFAHCYQTHSNRLANYLPMLEQQQHWLSHWYSKSELGLDALGYGDGSNNCRVWKSAHTSYTRNSDLRFNELIKTYKLIWNYWDLPAEWVRMCIANWDLLVKVIAHRSQLNGFSDTCDHRCAVT